MARLEETVTASPARVELAHPVALHVIDTEPLPDFITLEYD